MGNCTNTKKTSTKEKDSLTPPMEDKHETPLSKA